MIRYQCPACNAIHEAADSEAGNKLDCSVCGQRLQIPRLDPPTPPASVGVLVCPAELTVCQHCQKQFAFALPMSGSKLGPHSTTCPHCNRPTIVL